MPSTTTTELAELEAIRDMVREANLRLKRIDEAFEGRNTRLDALEERVGNLAEQVTRIQGLADGLADEVGKAAGGNDA